MSMPFYVAPEQWMKDKADFARKGIARGRALVALVYADGVLICAENSSTTLRKINEIYDRIAFAGAGKYNEYDRLRIAGVRHADLKGYSFSREDVDAQSLANAYAQMLGDVFTHEVKPMEVDILVAEVGTEPAGDRLFHILYDGTVIDEDGYTVLGGEAEAVGNRLKSTYEPGLSLDAALRVSVAALTGPDRRVPPKDLETAVLARGNSRRAFRRLRPAEVAEALGDQAAAGAEMAGETEANETEAGEDAAGTKRGAATTATERSATSGESEGDDGGSSAS